MANTLKMPKLCSEPLYQWIAELTEADKRQLWSWGITEGLLQMAKVPVDRNLIATLVDVWNTELHTFQLRQFEMTVTLQEAQAICQTRRISRLPAFSLRPSALTNLLFRMTGFGMASI
jgi:hypothetical protein